MSRFKCWKCKEPLDPGLRNSLPPETVRAICRGTQRARYLHLCKKCKIEVTPVIHSVRQIPQLTGAITTKHLIMLDHRCQICKIKDRQSVFAYFNTSRRVGRFLQRDLVALCAGCFQRNEKYLGVNDGRGT